MPDTPVITYSLRGAQECSCSFYRDRSTFTDETIAAGERWVGTLVDAYLVFLRETGREVPRTRPEYLFELLLLGVMWRAYGKDAMGLSGAAARLLAWLSGLRERYSRLKKAADFARGLLAGRLRPVRSSPPVIPSLSSVEDMDRLLRWMRAAGRFTQEIRRLQSWQAFFTSQLAERLPAVTAYAEWFETHSLAVFGRYTPQVERFLAETHPGYRWREDYVLCGRGRAEYHLNMVGTEILNRAFRADFLRAAKKVVLVPPCMRSQPDDHCRAVPTPFGARCMACTPGCRVHQLTRFGEKYGFEVFTLPDDLRIFSGDALPRPGREQVGIVGVSCVLTNIQGGWDVRDLGIPAQGLLLDYCGCSYHWHRQGIPTDIDFHQLLRTLGTTANRAEEP